MKNCPIVPLSTQIIQKIIIEKRKGSYGNKLIYWAAVYSNWQICVWHFAYSFVASLNIRHCICNAWMHWHAGLERQRKGHFQSDFIVSSVQLHSKHLRHHHQLNGQSEQIISLCFTSTFTRIRLIQPQACSTWHAHTHTVPLKWKGFSLSATLKNHWIRRQLFGEAVRSTSPKRWWW